MVELFRTQDGKRVLCEKVIGPASYPTGGFDVTISETDLVYEVLECDITGGYKAGGEPTTANVVRVKAYYQSGLSGTPLIEVVSGYILTTETVKVVAVTK